MSQRQDPAELRARQTEFFGRVGSIVGGLAGRLFSRDPRGRKRDASRQRDIHLPSPRLGSVRRQTRTR